MKPWLLRHLDGSPQGRFPVWLMRQAGRYLPNYRKLREKHSFWEMATTPELAAQVSLLPLEVLEVDAVIFFSDILTLPYGLGVPVEMKESVGPVVSQPLLTREAFEVFTRFRPESHTAFVGQALSLIRSTLDPEKALLGFAGAPWTVGCYLVEGRANRQFGQIKNWMHRDPADLIVALAALGEATLSYLKDQHAHGAEAVQLFDTWLSEMPRQFFVEYYLPLLNRIFDALRAEGIPTIYFTKHAHHLLDDLAQLRMDVLSTDELLKLGEVEARTQKKFSLQGNLDPVMLFGDIGVVRMETRKLVAEARKLSRPAILNLGHGILPGTPVENVKAFVDEARALWL